MVISLAQTLLSCAKFRPLRVIKKDLILLTLDWMWGRPQAFLQRRYVSSVRVGLANGTKRTPSQNWRNLLSELHVPHKQCLTGISDAFSASFTSIWPSFPRFYLPSAVPWISEDRLLNISFFVVFRYWLSQNNSKIQLTNLASLIFWNFEVMRLQNLGTLGWCI